LFSIIATISSYKVLSSARSALIAKHATAEHGTLRVHQLFFCVGLPYGAIPLPVALALM